MSWILYIDIVLITLIILAPLFLYGLKWFDEASFGKCKACGEARERFFFAEKIKFKALNSKGVQKEYTIKICDKCATVYNEWFKAIKEGKDTQDVESV